MFAIFASFAALVSMAPLLACASPARGGTPTISGGFPGATSHAKLHIAAEAAGKLYFGTATDNPELNDTAYTAILDDRTMFGQITPANSMKWFDTEPERDVFNFTDGDVIANLAKRNGQLLRGHNCVWHNQLPDWVTAGNFDAPTLASIVYNHCHTIVRHYAGHVYVYVPLNVCIASSQADELGFSCTDAWDVINEALNDDGTFREDVFFDTLNSSYIPLALHAARAADPKAKLYYNDFNIEGSGAKSTALQNLVKSLKASHTPIDGIGVQSHLIVGEVPTDMEENLRTFTGLGVEVAITELDVRMTLPVTAALLEQQKADYTTVVKACNAVPRCIGVTVWDFTDKFSWVPGTFAGQGAACPWDEELEKKPAFDGIVSGFTSR
ncbi:endo-beta-1,4-glucanase [Gloeopeniophorella convolvens]|nr:endo-beta-1,4-glucanase [Gloeopeniophorella convolvens]